VGVHIQASPTLVLLTQKHTPMSSIDDPPKNRRRSPNYKWEGGETAYSFRYRDQSEAPRSEVGRTFILGETLSGTSRGKAEDER